MNSDSLEGDSDSDSSSQNSSKSSKLPISLKMTVQTSIVPWNCTPSVGGATRIGLR